MNWIDSLERRFGGLAVPHLLRYVAMLNGLTFLLSKWKPGFFSLLTLDPGLIRGGQFWRIVSHIFIPGVGTWLPDWVGVALYLMFLVWLGDGLESAMGSFRLTLYYLLGVLGTVAAAFLAGESSGGMFLTNSLFFAFACLYPDREIYIFLFIPVKVKWLAWFDLILIAPLLLFSGWGFRAGILASFSNFLLFFGRELFSKLRVPEPRARRTRSSGDSPGELSLHSCCVCHRTEQTSPELEFRVARDGNEYCRHHLPGRGQDFER